VGIWIISLTATRLSSHPMFVKLYPGKGSVEGDTGKRCFIRSLHLESDTWKHEKDTR